MQCEAQLLADGRLRVRALPWAPDPVGVPEVLAAYSDEVVSRTVAITADPFWTRAHEYDHYRGQTQKQAARAAMLNDELPVVVALPTGRGKTAIAWSRPLLTDRGVTIVIVPTVVLAQDMERRTREEQARTGRSLSPVGCFAYIGSLDPQVKKALRDAVRSGRQRILYTSPEAFVSGLAKAVIDCASAGLLAQIVIDECHLVDQWGSDFRPEFQTLPGLVNEAKDSAPDGAKPAVLLMSATLSQRNVDVLQRMFGVDNELDIVWGSSLRDEPCYFVSRFLTESERSAAVLEALSLLPRPAIIYTTRVKDAERWCTALAAAGLKRVAAVTGATRTDERRRVIESWRGREVDGDVRRTTIDVVVGTSAFGLGVDMPNVRTVVHACFPETVDRFYQEVGRSGRDGRPSISFLATAPGDRDLAARLNRVTLIGDDKGFNRWLSLIHSASLVAPNRYRVRKSTLPPYMDAGYGESAAWNMRTLTLMANAGAIRLLAPQWTRPDIVSDDVAASLEEEFYSSVGDFLDFEISDGRLMSPDHWAIAAGAVRQSSGYAQAESFARMAEIVGGERCVGQVVAHHFQVRFAGGRLITVPSCRGCPTCRNDVDASTGFAYSEPHPSLPSRAVLSDPLAAWRGVDNWLLIAVEESGLIEDLLVRLAQRGLTVMVGVDQDAAMTIQNRVPSCALIVDVDVEGSDLLPAFAGPLVVLVSDQIPPPVSERIALGLPTYVIADAHLADAARPGWALRETYRSVSATALLRGL